MQNIGERLEEARKRKGISIREAAEATKIRGDYLHKFESNQFDINLPEIYVRGFLRTYAGYLKLPSEKIVADYKALGIGEPKSRPLNREIYGRMDLSVASSKDREDNPGGAGQPAGPGEPKPGDQTEHANPATFVPRSSGPSIDKDLLIKAGALVAGAIVLIVLIIWGVSAITNRGDDTVAATDAALNAEQRITLHALDTVRIKLVEETTQRELFQGTLVRGESRGFPKNGSLLLTASALENVEIEMHGTRVGTGATGWNRVRIE